MIQRRTYHKQSIYRTVSVRVAPDTHTHTYYYRYIYTRTHPALSLLFVFLIFFFFSFIIFSVLLYISLLRFVVIIIYTKAYILRYALVPPFLIVGPPRAGVEVVAAW